MIVKIILIILEESMSRSTVIMSLPETVRYWLLEVMHYSAVQYSGKDVISSYFFYITIF